MSIFNVGRDMARSWRWVASLALLTPGLLMACKTQSEGKKAGPAKAATLTPAIDGVVLEGRFETVGKVGSGSAKIVVEGGRYQLVLSGVKTEPSPLIHVFLVGLDQVTSSAAVDATDNKYDMGALTAGEQRIDLPSAPAAEVRSVVLWNVKYRANLASASLRPPG